VTRLSRADVTGKAEWLRSLAESYIDTQLATMARHGPPPSVSASQRDRMVDRIERFAIDAQPAPLRRALLRAVRARRAAPPQPGAAP
jgi:hypothetical protein